MAIRVRSLVAFSCNAGETRLYIYYYGILPTKGLQDVSTTKRYFFESPWCELSYS